MKARGRVIRLDTNSYVLWEKKNQNTVLKLYEIMPSQDEDFAKRIHITYVHLYVWQMYNTSEVNQIPGYMYNRHYF